MRYNVHRSSTYAIHAYPGAERREPIGDGTARAGHPWKAVSFLRRWALTQAATDYALRRSGKTPGIRFTMTTCRHNVARRHRRTVSRTDRPTQRAIVPIFIPCRGSNRPREMPARSRANRHAAPATMISRSVCYAHASYLLSYQGWCARVVL